MNTYFEDSIEKNRNELNIYFIAVTATDIIQLAMVLEKNQQLNTKMLRHLVYSVKLYGLIIHILKFNILRFNFNITSLLMFNHD